MYKDSLTINLESLVTFNVYINTSFIIKLSENFIETSQPTYTWLIDKMYQYTHKKLQNLSFIPFINPTTTKQGAIEQYNNRFV